MIKRLIRAAWRAARTHPEPEPLDPEKDSRFWAIATRKR
ncbi:hypothetical protein MAL1_00247 [Bacteriophage DSS3_MAL1]|nr:hypothetical protein MAL1_00247 [Bacteriophage DSS3_MAL1]